MVNKNELFYKIKAIIEYLKDNGGYDYSIYNHLCPINDLEPDSNIVEYAEDVLEMINLLLIDNKQSDTLFEELF